MATHLNAIGEDIIAGAAKQSVLGELTIVFLTGDEGIVAAAAKERIGALLAVQRVVTSPAFEAVIAWAAAKDVVSAEPEELVVELAAFEEDVKARSENPLRPADHAAARSRPAVARDSARNMGISSKGLLEIVLKRVREMSALGHKRS